MRTCHHLHGGLGMDISYPLPRYSALVTDLVTFVGGSDVRLDLLARHERGRDGTHEAPRGAAKVQPRPIREPRGGGA